jgi:hypothetical protein
LKDVEDLVGVPDPAWPELAAELAACPVPLTILPVDADAGRDCLRRLQVTARSRLGALALHTGGLVVDHGWLRVLGGGHPERHLPSLAEELEASMPPNTALLVGYDVLGGRFELTGPDPEAAGRPGEPMQVCYFAPDTLEWECLGFGHSTWLSWIAAGRTPQFYNSLRWPGWETEVGPLRLHEGISVVSFLWSKEAHDNLGGTSRAVVPIAELFDLQEDMAQTLAGLPNGTTVKVEVRRESPDSPR